jgi:hypothetical protein
MNKTPDIERMQSELRQKAEEIVREGADVRARTARLAGGAAAFFHETGEGFRGVANAVVRGALAAADQAVPDTNEGHLRSVAEGLADAFVMAAEAVDLTVRESNAAGRRFAEKDLQQALADLSAVSGMFAETVGGVARGIRSEGASQVNALADHARITFERTRPVVASALRTLTTDLGKASGEAGRAGTAAARAAAGTLFQEMGSRLSRWGQGLLEKQK